MGRMVAMSFYSTKLSRFERQFDSGEMESQMKKCEVYHGIPPSADAREIYILFKLEIPSLLTQPVKFGMCDI